MTFSEQVKNELASVPLKKSCCRTAEAFGMARFGKSCTAESVTLHTAHKQVADLYADLLVCLVGAIVTVTEVGQEGEHEKTLYLVEIEGREDRQAVLEYFAPNLVAAETDEPCPNECCLAALLRGAFLVCGRVTDPNKEYHLEFVLPDLSAASFLLQLLSKIGRKAKQTTRKGVPIVYMKESEQIEDLLTYMGAVKSTLELMDVKILKDVRNKVNRVTNCETANIGKTVAASSEQVRQIEWIIENKGVEYLPEQLRAVALLRLENPELSLAELSEVSGLGLSRSGIHHRLKKIAEIADRLQKKG